MFPLSTCPFVTQSLAKSLRCCYAANCTSDKYFLIGFFATLMGLSVFVAGCRRNCDSDVLLNFISSAIDCRRSIKLSRQHNSKYDEISCLHFEFRSNSRTHLELEFQTTHDDKPSRTTSCRIKFSKRKTPTDKIT